MTPDPTAPRVRKPENFYFWLGSEGSLESLTEPQFNLRIAEARKAWEDYLNVVEEDDN